MRTTFVGIVFINLLLGALISALYVTNPDLTPWGLVPASLAVGLLSITIFYQKLLWLSEFWGWKLMFFNSKFLGLKFGEWLEF